MSNSFIRLLVAVSACMAGLTTVMGIKLHYGFFGIAVTFGLISIAFAIRHGSEE
jgi:hypothetical protein